MLLALKLGPLLIVFAGPKHGNWHPSRQPPGGSAALRQLVPNRFADSSVDSIRRQTGDFLDLQAIMWFQIDKLSVGFLVLHCGTFCTLHPTMKLH